MDSKIFTALELMKELSVTELNNVISYMVGMKYSSLTIDKQAQYLKESSNDKTGAKK